MNVLELFKNITAFVFDMDGVLTDGTLFVIPGAAPVRKMHVKDGYALQLAVKKNYRVAVISGAFSPEAAERLHKLGVQEVFMRCENKREALIDFMGRNGLSAQEVLFMGDDIPDYDVMLAAGLPCCPSDGVAEIKEIAKYISPVKGGEGCVRDVIERVLKLQGNWSIDTLIKAQ